MHIQSVGYTIKDDTTIRIDFDSGVFVFCPENGGTYQEQLAEWISNGGVIAAAQES